MRHKTPEIHCLQVRFGRWAAGSILARADGEWLEATALLLLLVGIDFCAGPARVDALGGLADRGNGVGRYVSGSAVDYYGLI